MGSQQSAPQPVPPTTPAFSGLSFTQGFLLGQLSIALLIFFLVKFFIFGEPPSADDRAVHLASLRRARTLAHQNSLHSLHARTRSNSFTTASNNPNTSTHQLRHKNSRSVIRNPASSGGPSIGTILAKTYYNVKGHQPESLDWFNVLIAQTIAQLRADARQDDAVLTSLTELLNTGSKPDWIGEIKVTEIALGDEFPIFSNCRVMAAEEGFGVGATAGIPGSGGITGEEGRLQARMDVDLSDVITLGIETTLVLNYPKPFVAVLPVALAVTVVRFSGTLAVSFIPSSTPPSSSTSAAAPHTNSNTNDTSHPQVSSSASSSTSSKPTSNPTHSHRPTTLAFTFLDDYRLDLSVRSLVGSRSRLQDVPKIAQLIESRVHAWFDERAVEPRFQQIVLPSLWPRKKNTRGGVEGEGNDGEEVEVSGLGDVELRDDDEVPGVGPGLGGDGHEERDTILPSIEGPDEIPRGRLARNLSKLTTSSKPDSLEARMALEGAKLREAEIAAGERSRDGSGRSREVSASSGMRFRGDNRERERELGSRDAGGAARERESRFGPYLHERDATRETSAATGNGSRRQRPPHVSRLSSDWGGSGQRGMPGAMPGG